MNETRANYMTRAHEVYGTPRSIPFFNVKLLDLVRCYSKVWHPSIFFFFFFFFLDLHTHRVHVCMYSMNGQWTDNGI